LLKKKQTKKNTYSLYLTTMFNPVFHVCKDMVTL